MKSAFIKDIGRISILENDIISTSSDNDLFVKLKACGICGSDIEKVFGAYGMSSGRLGHEPAGEVIKVGKNIKNFSIGDRVFVHHHVSCSNCHYCRNGDFTMCDMYQKSNIDPCGLSEIFKVPFWNVSNGGVLKLPDNVTYEEAAMIEPLACCIRGLNKSRVKIGDSVAVFGAGPTGLMFINLLRLFGVNKIFLFDINEYRLNFLKDSDNLFKFNLLKNHDFKDVINANTNEIGVDISIIATSNVDALINSIDITRKGGKLLLFGVPPKDTKVSLNLNKIYSNELSLIPSYAASEIETNQALSLISSKRVNVSNLITHKFDISKTQEAFDCAHKGDESMKIIITSNLT